MNLVEAGVGGTILLAAAVLLVTQLDRWEARIERKASRAAQEAACFTLVATKVAKTCKLEEMLGPEERVRREGLAAQAPVNDGAAERSAPPQP